MKQKIGGVLHSYLKYDPQRYPSPTQPPPDIVSPMMNYMLAYGRVDELTEEQLARAIRLDPSQIKNFGPSIDRVQAILEDRKRKILETYETRSVKAKARRRYTKKADNTPELEGRLGRLLSDAIHQEQLYGLEQVWYAIDDDTSLLARYIVQLISVLGDKYQIDELDSKYQFVGRESMTIPQALEIKEELEKIDELLKQLEEARENAQIALIDMEGLSEFIDEDTRHTLEELQRAVENYVQEMAERQGVTKNNGLFQLTPQAYRVFQGKLLERIFSELKASRTGRHDGDVGGDGAVELQSTKPYEFGDSLTQMDIPQSLVNAMVRRSSIDKADSTLLPEDIEIHRTRNRPKCATVVIMDMSGSMRYEGQYINVKRMALALDGLIRTEYPGDFLGFIEMYSFAKVRRQADIIDLMPKMVTLHDSVVRLKADMSDENMSEHMVHPHFTNIQHSLRLARQLLANQDTPNRQIVLITDGLPTAHFEDSMLYLLYPPHPQTEEATLREGLLCTQEQITINMFMVPSWSQSEEDVRFAYRLCESTSGRVFFTAGGDLDRFVVWDYVKRKREILS